jgi:archaellum component FlaC
MIETIKHKCLEYVKDLFGIKKVLNKLKTESEGIIKSFDVSHRDIIKVVYMKKKNLEFTWEDIKKQIEDELLVH